MIAVSLWEQAETGNAFQTVAAAWKAEDGVE